MPNSPTAIVEVKVKTGSKYELKKQAGISHFLEHMCFKATKKRPTSKIILGELDAIGANYNAFTGTEATGYYAKAQSGKIEKLIDIVADIYSNSIFKKEDMEKERGVIIQEINMYEDDPQSVVGDLYTKTVHGDQSAGRPIGGFKETVSKLTTDDLDKYKKSQYVAKNTTVVVAGTFNEEKVVKLVGKSFGSLPKTKSKAINKTKIFRNGPRIGIKNKITDQTHLIMGVRTFPMGDKRNTALWALGSVLSGGMSSRLFQRMREELGICYYIAAGNHPATDHGEFNVWAGVDPLRVDEAVKEISLELNKLKTEFVGEEELKKAVDASVARMYMGLETCGSVSGYYASRWAFHRDLKDPIEREKQLRAITPKDIQKVAREIFKSENLIFSMVGKDLKKDKTSKIVRQAIKNW